MQTDETEIRKSNEIPIVSTLLSYSLKLAEYSLVYFSGPTARKWRYSAYYPQSVTCSLVLQDFKMLFFLFDSTFAVCWS